MTLCLYSNFSTWSTFSSTVNFCNINCVIFSDTHCSFGPPILWHSSISCGGVSVLVKSWRWSVKICHYQRLYLCLPFNNLSKLVHKSSSQKAVKIVQRAVYSKKFASGTWSKRAQVKTLPGQNVPGLVKTPLVCWSKRTRCETQEEAWVYVHLSWYV